MWHVEALGRADLGVDQPLLEVPEASSELLLQQTLLVLTLPGRAQAQAGGGGGGGEVEGDKEKDEIERDGRRQGEG